jgi:CRP-like cAMP-binding protein
MGCLQEASFHDGDAIVRQGELGDRFFILVSGTVSVEELKPGADEPQVLTRLYAGCHFGEYSLLREQPRLASVVARGADPVVAKYLTKTAFLALVEQDATYSTVVRALVEETENTRRKREEAAKAGSLTRAAGVRFVAETNFAKFTHTVKRSKHGATQQEMINTYAIGKLLGSGAYGRVYKCADTAEVRPDGSAAEYAIKILDKAKMRRRQRLGRKRGPGAAGGPGAGAGGGGGGNNTDLLREVEVMKKLRHPNLVALREVLDDPGKDQLYIVQVSHPCVWCGGFRVGGVCCISVRDVRDVWCWVWVVKSGVRACECACTCGDMLTRCAPPTFNSGYLAVLSRALGVQSAVLCPADAFVCSNAPCALAPPRLPRRSSASTAPL